MADKFKFSIPIGWEDLAQKLSYAAEQQLGVEIAAFASGPAVFDAATRTKVANSLCAVLQDFPNRRSFHGAFIDISLHSVDPAIAAIARERIERDLELASRLDCKIIVFHTGFNPLIPVQGYEDEFIDQHAAFWPRMADAWPEITICLENMWEPSPDLLKRLLRSIDHPRVGLCLDVAHAHAYSHFAADTWLRRMSEQITHMHWNDNFGDTDSHLSLGEGNIDWGKIISATRALSDSISVVLELKSLESFRESLKYLNTLKSRPATKRVSSRVYSLPEFGQ